MHDTHELTCSPTSVCLMYINMYMIRMDECRMAIHEKLLLCLRNAQPRLSRCLYLGIISPASVVAFMYGIISSASVVAKQRRHLPYWVACIKWDSLKKVCLCVYACMHMCTEKIYYTGLPAGNENSQVRVVVCIDVCIDVCMYLCMYVPPSLCVWIWLCIYLCIYMYTHTQDTHIYLHDSEDFNP